MPVEYEIEVNRFVFSDIVLRTLIIAVCVCTVVLVLMLIYMVYKYKRDGFIGAISIIGYIAILLIALRYANVNLTITGLVIIGVAVVLEYLAFMRIFAVNSKDIDEETNRKELKTTLLKELEELIPLVVIAIVFAVSKWEPIYGIGMVLFWAILIAITYNMITLKLINSINKNK